MGILLTQIPGNNRRKRVRISEDEPQTQRRVQNEDAVLPNPPSRLRRRNATRFDRTNLVLPHLRETRSSSSFGPPSTDPDAPIPGAVRIPHFASGPRQSPQPFQNQSLNRQHPQQLQRQSPSTRSPQPFQNQSPNRQHPQQLQRQSPSTRSPQPFQRSSSDNNTTPDNTIQMLERRADSIRRILREDYNVYLNEPIGSSINSPPLRTRHVAQLPLAPDAREAIILYHAARSASARLSSHRRPNLIPDPEIDSSLAPVDVFQRPPPIASPRHRGTDTADIRALELGRRSRRRAPLTPQEVAYQRQEAARDRDRMRPEPIVTRQPPSSRESLRIINPSREHSTSELTETTEDGTDPNGRRVRRRVHDDSDYRNNRHAVVFGVRASTRTGEEPGQQGEADDDDQEETLSWTVM